MENRYKDGKIYQLYIDGIDDCYVGSTLSDLVQRLSAHKNSHTYDSQNKTKACELFDKGEVKIRLLEAFACETKDELLLKEREWLEKTPTAINKNVPGRGWKEERQMNAPKYAKKIAEWREANAEHVAEYTKEYQAKNREHILAHKKKMHQENALKDKEYKQTPAICEVCQYVTTKGNMWRHKKIHATNEII